MNSNNYVITCRHDLAIQGFQWATDTIQKRVDETPDASYNRSEILSRPSKMFWQKYGKKII